GRRNYMHRRGWIVVCFIVFSLMAAQAEAPSGHDMQLVGDRFKPLKCDEMTPAQITMSEHLFAGERRGAGGPFNVLLRSPEMGDLAQQFGASMRFHSSLPKKLNEMAIIITARHWTAQYEWTAHRKAAAEAGLSESIIQAIAAGQQPSSPHPAEPVVYNFRDAQLTRQPVCQHT